MFYKNASHVMKTFYNVTFKPGEVKEVHGFINDSKMIRVDGLPKEPPVRSKIKPTSIKHTEPKSTESVDDANLNNEQGGNLHGDN